MTATVHSGVRFFRRKAKKIAKLRWKVALLGFAILGIAGFFAFNWIYQVARKPGELLAPVSGSLAKSPDSTWQSYGSLFEKYSTNIISPEFLAALAQVEGSGNPIANT